MISQHCVREGELTFEDAPFPRSFSAGMFSEMLCLQNLFALVHLSLDTNDKMFMTGCSVERSLSPASVLITYEHSYLSGFPPMMARLSA